MSSMSSLLLAMMSWSSDLSSAEVVDRSRQLGDCDGFISTCLYSEQTSSLRRMDSEKMRTEIDTRVDLLPPTPSVYVESASQAFSPHLLHFCLQKPIVVVRNLAHACAIDLSLFATKTLVRAHPNHPVEVRTQMEQSSDENWDPTMSKQVWYCTSTRSHTTIAKFAEYQASSLEEAVLSEKNDSLHDDDDQSNDNALKVRLMGGSSFPNVDTSSFTKRSTRRMIKFGTNCDLSDEKKWAPQLKELLKLPAWVRVVSPSNMLSHVGHQILGMNTVQLYMKVPCARTPGHQENNNFCAVNLNVGPGDSEWFGVPNEYWDEIRNMCDDNRLNYLHGSWWPNISDLIRAGIPTYRFLQRPGDMVWVNAGCVHWVQASGWCNNIAWNVGPLTHRQYVLALERYEWNKKERYQSIVAMAHLSWNLARNVKVVDRNLHEQLRLTLQQSLRMTVQMLSFAQHKGVPIYYHGKKRNEPAHYCMTCDEEVFNVLWVKEGEKGSKQHTVYCLKCALKKDGGHLSRENGWSCLKEFRLEELMRIYDEFTFDETLAKMEL